MERTIRTDYYYFIYDNDQEDMVWYSPSSDNKSTCDRNLLNCIAEARKILRRNPNADIKVCAHYYDTCGDYEDGCDGSFTVCAGSELDKTEEKIRKVM